MSRLVASNKGYVVLAITARRKVSAELQCLFKISIDDDRNDLGEMEEHGLYVLRQNQFYPKPVREFQISSLSNYLLIRFITP